MDEKKFIQDLWDLVQGHTEYITPEEFRERYGDLFVEPEYNESGIVLRDDNSEWLLSIRKTWSNNNQNKPKYNEESDERY